MEPPTVLTDPADPRFDDYRNLRGAQRRGNAATNDAVIAEGRIAVERLLSSRYRVRSVLTVSSRPAAMPTLRHELPAFATTPAVLAEVCGFDFHRGVLAAADRITAATPDEVLTATRVAVLEGISDAENLGAIFRTATALGVGGLLLDERCIDPLYRRVVRVSMGWSLHVPWAWLPPLPHGLATLRASGHRVVALTPLHTAVAVDDAGHFG
ncbi:MAG: TrmH family RNA methyltransferase, partial [Actinomycetes bacterium]